MNECTRELRDVNVQLDLPPGSYPVTVWREQQARDLETHHCQWQYQSHTLAPGYHGTDYRKRQTTRFVSSQVSRYAIKQAVISQPRIETSFGDAHATILSFGPELTWLYAYLAAEKGVIKSAKLRIKLSDREEVLTDETYPFEFSLPLNPSDHIFSIVYQVINARDEIVSVNANHFQ